MREGLAPAADTPRIPSASAAPRHPAHHYLPCLLLALLLSQPLLPALLPHHLLLLLPPHHLLPHHLMLPLALLLHPPKAQRVGQQPLALLLELPMGRLSWRLQALLALLMPSPLPLRCWVR